MTTSILVSRPAGQVATRSIVSVSATALLAAITHAYDFGPAAFAVGGLVVSLLTAAGLGYQRTGRRLLAVIYALASLWIVAGFGVVGGLWNHAVKVLLCAGHGGTVPPSIAEWFLSPEPGTALFETVGILTFVASVVAAVFGYRFLRSKTSGSGALP